MLSIWDLSMSMEELILLQVGFGLQAKVAGIEAS
jgi:hypothetical protein